MKRLIPALVALALVATACNYAAALRVINASGGTAVPWWCQGPPDLTPQECLDFSFELDVARAYAYDRFDLDTFVAEGATEVATRPAGVGVPFALPGCCAAFDPQQPNMLLYDGNASGARLVGMMWAVDGVSAPAGFVGSRDVWTGLGGRWFLPVWKVRGYEYQPDVFNATHPCLMAGVTLTSTADACYVAAHPLPFEVMNTNDDGIGAPGIDAIVEALRVLPDVNVTVVAPAVNQSGTGDSTTPGGVTASPGTTASGYAGTAVDGTPGDSVLYGIEVLGLNPDLVVSGINEGQNIGPVVPLSGTVGAAKWAVRKLVPAVAASQGIGGGVPADFPSGVTAVLDWVEEFRLGTVGPEFMHISNINIPSCAAGSIRGTVETVVAAAFNGRSFVQQDCTSTVTVINDDVDAFNHGFIGIAEVKP